MIDHALLPSTGNARLPAAYERAKAQLAECARIDECKEWADKAAALASYAKQSDDETLENHAIRIRARALKRCGELLRAIEPAHGANQNVKDGSVLKVTRKQAAIDAGLSERQRKTALRVASVPEEEFDAAVDAEKPARIPELAKRGTKSKSRPLLDLGGRDPEEFHAATKAQGEVRRLADLGDEINPSAVVRGLLDRERPKVLAAAKRSQKWLDRLVSQLERKLEQ